MSGRFFADRQTARRRLEVCRGCEFAIGPRGRPVLCAQCGCPPGVNAQLAGATCPVGKWSLPTGVKK